jgi:hypothetical protein
MLFVVISISFPDSHLMFCNSPGYLSKRPPLWSSGQSFWLQIQRPVLDSRRYQIFWEVVGLERGSFSLVSTTEELLWRKGSGTCLEIREYGRKHPSHWPRGTLYSQKLALTSPTSGGHSVGIVCSRTQITEFVCLLFYLSKVTGYRFDSQISIPFRERNFS